MLTRENGSINQGIPTQIKLKSTFRSYEDEKFALIMKNDNISSQEMMRSLSLEDNRKMVFKAGEGAGKSGSFFFFSHDNRFLIKTLQGKEKSMFLGMLDEYIHHIECTG